MTRDPVERDPVERDPVERDPVERERRRGIAVLRLARPEVHNVVDAATLERLEHHVAQLAEDGTEVLVLTAAGGRTFCAGADLSYVAALTDHRQGLELSRRMRAVLASLEDGPRPVIAAINGDALGGGCEILTACHLRIAASTARFSFRQAAMGVVTGWGGGARLFRLLGKSKALRLLLTAETIDAAEALTLGFVDRVVPAAELMDEALATAGRIAANSPDSIRAFLALAQAVERPDDAVAELEERLFERLWDGEHFRRKVAQWRQRRRG